jgi:peptidoglycan/LPS O-acetylase OafA/YrhL
MNRQTSLYLDAIRALAALAVLISHVASRALSGGLLWQLAALGQPAVDVFFVLSGFVIAHVVSTREQHGADYVRARAARLYSGVVPALALTFVLDHAGRAFNPGFYAHLPNPPLWNAWHYATALSFTNEIWGAHLQPGSNLPYWSLGFEAWYYAAFGLALFAPRGWRIGSAALCLAVAGPWVAALAPLWGLGVLCHQATRRWPPSPLLAWWVVALTKTLAVAWLIWVILGHPPQADLPYAQSLTNWRSYDLHYAAGLFFALNLWGFAAINPAWVPVLGRFATPIRWAARASFPLYLVHVPVVTFLDAITPGSLTAALHRTLVISGTLLAAAALTPFTEWLRTAAGPQVT